MEELYREIARGRNDFRCRSMLHFGNLRLSLDVLLWLARRYRLAFAHLLANICLSDTTFRDSSFIPTHYWPSGSVYWVCWPLWPSTCGPRMQGHGGWHWPQQTLTVEKQSLTDLAYCLDLIQIVESEFISSIHPGKYQGFRLLVQWCGGDTFIGHLCVT